MKAVVIIVIILLAAGTTLAVPATRRRLLPTRRPAPHMPTFIQPKPAPVPATHRDPDLQDAIMVPAFNYGQAKAHNHGMVITEDFIFNDRKLVDDPANNPGNNFLGNALLVQDRAGQKHLLWWDSSADIGRATQLLAVSMSTNRATPLEVTYDPTCQMIISVRLK
jgi:hypothetical protein